MVTLDSSVEELPGYRKGYAAAFQKLKLATLRDLLYHFPRRHQDYSKLVPIARLRPGEEVTIEARVVNCQAVGLYNRPGRRVEATFADATGTIRGVWFRQEWRAKQLHEGMQLYVSGKVEAFGGRLQFTHPDYEPVTDEEAIHTGRLVPVYPLSGDLQGNWLRAKIKWIVDELAHTVEDPLPPAFRSRWDLPPLHAALQQFHFPDDERELATARRRIAFEDSFILQLALSLEKTEWQRLCAPPLPHTDDQISTLVSRLPFKLTSDQQMVLGQVLADMASCTPMARLLQGDVGSGKTVIAALASLVAAEHGYQTAILAPLEVLAEQHARTLTKLFISLRPMLAPVLITGNLSSQAREHAWSQVASGQALVIVGTHALIARASERRFHRLGLLVLDEQQRFGVSQRAELLDGNNAPHVLSMTATPVARTLFRVQGEAGDVSLISERPVGRLPIKTRYTIADRREQVYAFIRTQIGEGRQAYIICPYIETNDRVAVKSVVEEYERLRTFVFPDLRLGLMHGKLRASDKESVMRDFHAGRLDMLVATTAVEVGIDVPNATTILIEGAERFGLAQLHQLRGRVGRGSEQSYCILMGSESIDDEGVERLRLVESTQDGFALAEHDLWRRLESRDAGTILAESQRKSTFELRRVFTIYRDLKPGARQEAVMDITRLAHRAALDLITDDPSLSRQEHALLQKCVADLRSADRKLAAEEAKRKGYGSITPDASVRTVYV